MRDSQSSLIARWQQADEQAIWTVFDQYYPKAVNIAILSGLPAEDAQDCAQEAFLHAFERRQQLRDPVAFPLWFHRILTTFILNALKQKQRLKEISLDDAREPIENIEPEQDTNLDEMMIRKEQRAALWLDVQKLSPHYRVPLVLYYYGNFSLHEVATLTGKREGTIRVTIHRALQQLRTLIQNTQAQDTDHRFFSNSAIPLSQKHGG